MIWQVIYYKKALSQKSKNIFKTKQNFEILNIYTLQSKYKLGILQRKMPFTYLSSTNNIQCCARVSPSQQNRNTH